MGLMQYIEPSWLQDLITSTLSLLMIPMLPVICLVAVVIICPILIAIDYDRRQPGIREIVKMCAGLCARAFMFPFNTIAHASSRFAYRASRLAYEIRRYRATRSEPVPSWRDQDPPQREADIFDGDSDELMSYDYPKLRGDHDIRLFEIYPSGGDAMIGAYNDWKVKGRIIHSNLLWSPSYEAISYTWTDERGNSAQTEEVYIPTERATISVTKNCISVLKQLRHPTKRRLVWIDAICIDQGSDPDRTHQVSLMARIYMSANRVIAYTGSATKESDILFDWMNNLHHKDLFMPANSEWAEFLNGGNQARGGGQLDGHLEHIWTWLTILSYKAYFRCDSLWSAMFRSHQQASVDDVTSLSDQQLLDAATGYLSRRWFQRVWVLQEVSLPDVRKIVIMCGKKSTSAMRALHSLSLLPMDGLGSVALGRYFLMLRKKVMSPDKSHLLDVLIETRDRYCSDPRDKIFGVLSIASGLDEGRFPDLVADYDLSTARVYAEYSAFFIESHGLAFFWSLIKSQPAVPGLPSWSADWTVPWPNYRVVRERHLPATSGKANHLDSSASFETDFDGTLLLRVVWAKVTRGVFTRDGHLDGSDGVTVEEVGGLEGGHRLVELYSGVCALLRKVGPHHEFIQLCPHALAVGGLFQVVNAWTEYVVDGQASTVAGSTAGRESGDYLSGLRTYLIR
ncbi:hypothetical protein Daus18300_008167 [Diaporthe australafricana]|uniref:Heterokaryon incompatibility domain-containing protein n=1 Tax=Diaporthe australafricana TaxID=127596 RepID=A0ABR3WJN3_9PEZI